MPIAFNCFSRFAYLFKSAAKAPHETWSQANFGGSGHFFARLDNYPLKRFITRVP